jgi:predicted small secreted protein
MKTIFKFAISILCITTFLFLTACNTAAGFGKDLQAGGQGIQKAAEEKNY